MVKLRTMENVQEYAILVFTTKTEIVYLEDAQMDSKTMDLEDVSAQLCQLEYVNHQPLN